MENLIPPLGYRRRYPAEEMNYNDSTFTGRHGDYFWIQMRDRVIDLRREIIEHFAGAHLAIAAFDSGPITPSAEERNVGWRDCGSTMLSPPLSESTEIPLDQNDEWYIFKSIPDSVAPDHLYVHFIGFTLVDPNTLRDSQDPTWDRNNHDWLFPVQASFWSNIDRYQPVAYLLCGDDTLLVTRDEEFLELISSN